jgi:histidyl-tRNA synthetase
MRNFGIKQSDFEIRISSRTLINAVMSDWHKLDDESSYRLQKLIDKKKKMTHKAFEQAARDIAGEAFSFFSFDLASEAYEEAMAIESIRNAKHALDHVIKALHDRGVTNVVFDSELIRGFDYYTGIVFEVFDKHPGNNRSLFGGGRYDELLSLFGGESVAAVGFGMGDMTIADALETYGLLPASLSSSTTHVSLLPMDGAHVHADALAAQLRKAGINAAVNISAKKLSDQIKHAEKSRIPHVIVIGENEIASGTYTLKNIVTGKETAGDAMAVIAELST